MLFELSMDLGGFPPACLCFCSPLTERWRGRNTDWAGIVHQAWRRFLQDRGKQPA